MNIEYCIVLTERSVVALAFGLCLYLLVLRSKSDSFTAFLAQRLLSRPCWQECTWISLLYDIVKFVISKCQCLDCVRVICVFYRVDGV